MWEYWIFVRKPHRATYFSEIWLNTKTSQMYYNDKNHMYLVTEEMNPFYYMDEKRSSNLINLLRCGFEYQGQVEKFGYSG